MRPKEAAEHAERAVTAGLAAEASLKAKKSRIDRLVREQLSFVWRVLRRLGLSPSDADDAAQRVFMIATSRIDTLNYGSERAFLYQTAAHIADKVRRTYRRRPDYAPEELGESVDTSPNAEQLVDQSRARQRLDSLLDCMPRDLRTVFVLFEIEGMSQPEIAQALRVPQGTVASRLRRAREVFTRRAAQAGLLPRSRGVSS